jgi:hypothetical protein
MHFSFSLVNGLFQADEKIPRIQVVVRRFDFFGGFKKDFLFAVFLRKAMPFSYFSLKPLPLLLQTGTSEDSSWQRSDESGQSPETPNSQAFLKF